MNIDRLKKRVSSIEMFATLGQPTNDGSITRIMSWDDWDGPEDSNIEKIALTQQELHDNLISSDEEKEWSDALDLIAESLSGLVPYDPEEDAYYAPNMAVWFAAWTFALEEAYLSKNLAVPRFILAQIYWYEKGRWPCALLDSNNIEESNDYVIF